MKEISERLSHMWVAHDRRHDACRDGDRRPNFLREECEVVQRGTHFVEERLRCRSRAWDSNGRSSIKKPQDIDDRRPPA